MSQNDDTRDEELLARYRRASADAPGPSDAVRAAILAESRRVAEELANRTPQPTIDVSRPAANDSRWKIPVFGTVGAALIAALLVAPRYWENAPPARVSMAPAPPPALAPATVAAPAPKAESLASARQSPSDSNSLQEVVVTGADRKSSKSYKSASPIAATPAPTPPPSVAQNYAPVSPSATPLAAAPAARLRAPDRSAQGAENRITAGAENSITGGYLADSALKPATLDSAVAQGDLAQTALLLDKGAVIDARDEAGRTPLMIAVTQNRLEIVRLLLARGADPNAADSTGHTPLQQATKRNLQDIAAMLQQAGAH